MRPAIEIKRLGKKYKLTPIQPYLALRDMISNGIKNLFGRKKIPDESWALQDVDLTLQPGERLGIIGKNGAGKSTLLKILSRITPPSAGEAFVNGRVGSLLEVGTGFHNELTGRENIFFNGSILGLKRKEIQKNLDAIIGFSGVEKFIDMPLKTYSSGMQMRLAFAIASHLDTEILLIDEVLAVGDLEFQRKCIGKMEEVSQQQGKTVLFVSHNLTHLKQLCDKAIWLKEGKVMQEGNVPDTVSAYVGFLQNQGSTYWKAKGSSGDYFIEEIYITEEGNQPAGPLLLSDKNYVISLKISARERIDDTIVALRFTNQENIPVLTTSNADETLQRQVIEAGYTVFRIPFRADLLIPGVYSVEAAWMIPHVKLLDHAPNALVFEVQDDTYAGHVLQDGRLEIFHEKLQWQKA